MATTPPPRSYERLTAPVASRLCALLLVVACSACSTLSLDAAKTLAASGKEASVKIEKATIASASEYSRAMDAEAFIHGKTGTASSAAYELAKARYEKVRKELAARGAVLVSMTDFYEAFGNLASFGAQEETQKSLQSLGDSIDAYRSAVGKGPIPASTFGIISSVGGLLAAEVQKSAVRQASAAVRPQLEAFHATLDDTLVREQFVGFRQLLGTDRKLIVTQLWEAGVFDPTPLIADAGLDAGLAPGKDAAARVLKDQSLSNGLAEVVNRRLEGNIAAMARGYDDSVKLIAKLVSEHKKLEEGSPSTLRDFGS